MPKFNAPINAFTAGEFSPEMWGRYDIEPIKHALAQAENIVIHPQGGFSNRAGTQAVLPGNAALSWLSGTDRAGVRMIPFVGTDRTRWILILGSAPGSLKAVKVISGPSTTTSFTISSITPPSRLYYQGTVGWGGLLLGEMRLIKYAQIADTIICTHPSEQPFIIRYNSTAGTWSMDWYQGWALALAGTTNSTVISTPFLEFNSQNNQGQGSLTASAATGSITLTSSAGIFKSGHVGALFKLSAAATTGWCVVTGYTNSTTVSAEVLSTVPTVAVGITVNTSWEESAWSIYRGWPQSVTVFQERIIFGGNLQFPDRIWASEQGNYTNIMRRKLEQDPTFADDVTNDWVFEFDVASTELERIYWMSGGQKLIIGTNSREITASGTNGALGPLDVQIEPQSAYGSSEYASGLRIGNTIYFPEANGFKIRELLFNFNEDSFTGQDVTLYNQKLTFKMAEKVNNTTYAAPGFVGMCVSKQDGSRLWAYDYAGGLHSCTIDKDNGTQAWSTHYLGGYGTPSGRPPMVGEAVVLPSSGEYGSEEMIFLYTNRYVAGAYTGCIEMMGRRFFSHDITAYTTQDQPGGIPRFCDYSKAFTLATVVAGVLTKNSVLTGLSYLEGETVVVVGDGKYLGEYVVASGQITLNVPVYFGVVGLKYRSIAKTLPIEAGSYIGSAQGLHKTLSNATIRFMRTVGGKFGKSEDSLETILFRPGSLAMGTAIPMFTGDKRVSVPTGYDRAGQVVVVQDIPLPMTVTAIMLEGVTSG